MPKTPLRRSSLGALSVAALTLVAGPLSSDAAQISPSVTLNIADGTWIRADEPLEIRLSQPVGPSSGRLAVMIGPVDWTGLFDSSDRTLSYRPTTMRLPQGEQPVIVYLVSPDNTWQEISRFQLRVLARGGYEKVEARPSIDVINKGQLAEDHFPATPEPAPGAPPPPPYSLPRLRFQDFGVNAGLRTTLVRNGWTTQTQVNFVGMSHTPERLRYGLKQAEAPAVDLANYVVDVQNHVAKFSLGHVNFGAHRHLFNSFASRGGLAWVKFGPQADLTMTALSGSTIVGWNNVLGFQQSQHRVVGGTLGIELTKRPGALRVEFTGLDGTLLPLSNFNQGLINDAQDSTGGGIRVAASDRSQRLRLDAGYARSKFVNPLDPLLAQGIDLVPVEDASRDARYLDVSYGLVHNKLIGGKTPTSVVAAFRHEKVEPLYGSVMSFVRADLFQNVGEVTANIGSGLVQASYTSAHDNLSAIETILETQTRIGLVNAMLPLASFVANPSTSWLPSVTYTLNRSHQFGAALPLNSDFQDTHVPDQMNTNQLFGVEWARTRWRGAYRFNKSTQDNRQIGRALSDLFSFVNNVSVGVIDSRADLNVEVAFEGADNTELVRTDLTRRVGVNGNWRPTSRTTITAIVSTTFMQNDTKTSEGHATDLNIQFAQSFPLSKRTTGKPQGQFFVRYARQSVRLLDQLFGLDDRRRLWTFNTGVNLSLF